MNVIVESRAVRGAWDLPLSLRERLRKMALDSFDGKVELNIKRGKISSFNVVEHIEVPRDEIR